MRRRSTLLAAQESVDICDETLRIDGFGKIAVESGGHALLAITRHHQSRHGNDRSPAQLGIALEFPRHGIAIQSRQMDVAKNEVRAFAQRGLDTVLAITGSRCR